MGLRSIFSGKGPEDLEKEGDRYMEKGQYGAARLEYEKAVLKLEKKGSNEPSVKERIAAKQAAAEDALAAEHLDTAKTLMETGQSEDARSLLELASELAHGTELTARIRETLAGKNGGASAESLAGKMEANPAEERGSEIGEDHFQVLIEALPEAERAVYSEYGESFRNGYIKLNQGDFEAAAALLSQALTEQDESPGYIPLELATACLNLGRNREARRLLEEFLAAVPDSERGAALFCEILWDAEEFDTAHAFLESRPESLRNSPAGGLLLGETLYRERRYDEAETLYKSRLEGGEWDEGICLGLAKTLEALGRPAEARDQYAQIMNTCRQCGKRVEPFVQQRFADAGLAANDYSKPVLEVYLSLVRDISEGRAENCEKISRICAERGEQDEAERFRRLAQEYRGEA